VKSRPSILRYLDDIIASAEYELMLSLTPSLLERFASKLEERAENGIAIEILVSPTADAPSPEEFDYLSIATTVRGRRGITTPVVAVADGYYSMYATRESIRGDNDRYGVIFNRSELGFLVSGFFNMVLWTTSEEIISDGEDLPFPRRYGTIRRCISDLQVLEGDFYATIEGRTSRPATTGSSKDRSPRRRSARTARSRRLRSRPTTVRSTSVTRSRPTRTSRPSRSASDATNRRKGRGQFRLSRTATNLQPTGERL